jgi:hypothetical protein
MEVGARVVEMQEVDSQRQPVKDPLTGQPMIDPLTGLPIQKVTPARRLVTGAADARYQRPLGQGGLLTVYGEFAGSDRQDPGAPNGWAGMGFLRLSHPMLEGTLSGRKQSQGFTALGNDSTRFGKLDDEVRLSATGYPIAWLPTTVFFDRQRSWVDDAGGNLTDSVGTIQHAMARVQLNMKRLPMLSQQVGSAILENPNFKTDRVQSVSQFDYDKELGFDPAKAEYVLARKDYNRIYRFDNRAVWASGAKLDLELYQLHQVSVTAQDHHESATQTQLQNRIVYRPIFSGPITLRLNYQDTSSLNDPSLGGVPGSWADQTLYQGILDAATLYLYQRDGVFGLFGHGNGATEGVSFYVGAGTIWRMGDKIYLDGGVQYDGLRCLLPGGPAGSNSTMACTAVSRITPRLYLTVNL